MAKDKDTGKALLDALTAHIASQMGGKATPAAVEEDFEWPSLQEINSMKLGDLSPIAERFSVNIEGAKISKVRTLLATAAAIVAEEDVDELEEDDINALAESLDIEPAKKQAATVKKLQEYFNEEEAGDDDDEDEKPAKKGKKKKVVDDDDDEKGDDDDEDETDKKKKKKSKKSDDDDEDKEDDEAEPDGVDRAEIAKEADSDDFPDEDEMTERLEAYNTAAEENDGEEIDINPKKLEKSYRSLVAELVDSEGDIAEWGKPYPRDGQAWCCGFPLEQQDEETGKCLVTGKLWTVDDEDEFVEVKKKKGKK